jgi:hypothetical protein
MQQVARRREEALRRPLEGGEHRQRHSQHNFKF